jgi:hypothetical protein
MGHRSSALSTSDLNAIYQTKTSLGARRSTHGFAVATALLLRRRATTLELSAVAPNTAGH